MIKRQYIKFFLLTGFLILSSVDYSALKASEQDLAGIELPPVNTFVLKNGAKVFYIQDELPQLTVLVSIGFGKLYETRDNAGISSLIARLLSLSGSKKYPGSKLHEKIDSIGGRISIYSSWENTVISIKVLKRFKDEAFDIIADLINNPNFNNSYLKTSRDLISEQIKRKYDDPADIAFEKTREIIFDGNGYGAVRTVKKIQSYTLNEIDKTWKRYFKAKNLLIGVSTSIDILKIKNYINRSFSHIEKGKKIIYNVEKDKINSIIRNNKNKIFLYPKDIPQATIVIGTIAPDISYKGDYALSIMNYILGGGSFNSRLMREVRVKRGLAYVVHSVIRSRYKTGVFLAYAQTKNETVNEVLSLMIENIEGMSKNKIIENDLNWAKRSISNSYVFNFDTPINILSNYINIEYNNLPRDYYNKYLDYINNVKGDDILHHSRVLLQGGLIKVVVGKAELKDKLKKYGEVVILK